MKKLVLLMGILLLAISVSVAQDKTIILEGTQIKGTPGNNAQLICNPIETSKPLEIVRVEGQCDGFWITNGSNTIHTFWDLSKPIGTILQPGVYYVFPNLKQGSNTAKVTVYLKPQ